MCKLTTCTLNTTAGIFTKRLSDHQPYFIFLNTANPKIATPKYIGPTCKLSKPCGNFKFCKWYKVIKYI